MYQETRAKVGSMLEFTGSDMNLERQRQKLEGQGLGRRMWVLHRTCKLEHKVKGQK